ncbi:MAG: ketol-acid reductoisomerase [Candidatus Gracilibacteria bacterium]|nr:ketol-acid reductoisomerase [Candidatus Gracilibacteria bacterium]
MSNIIHDNDVKTNILDNKKIAVIGYGAQGRAQARMMHESRLDVVVGVRENGPSYKQVQEDGLKVATIEEASKQADIIHILIPDEHQQDVYEKQIEPNMKDDATLSFSHGFNIIYKRIQPKEGVDVIMVAPKCPGTEEYKRYKEGFGVPALVAIHQDVSGEAMSKALEMSKAMYFTKAGVMICTFAEETYEDLFGEQAVLCGGLAQLIKYGFETLVEAGYPAEFAYFECLHEMKLIVDLVYEGGFSRMNEVVSNTAEFGGYVSGSRVVGPEVKERMKEVLKDIENGKFAEEWMKDARKNNMKRLMEYRKAEKEHQIEKVGKNIRDLFEK